MIKIAILEDETVHAQTLERFLLKFGKTNKIAFDINKFFSAVKFLDAYTADYSVVFMDIRMPYMDGIEAAHKLRELDENVIIIFVTNLRQYAINGYEVQAADFMVKPLVYGDFALKMARVLRKLPKELHGLLILPTLSGNIRVSVADIVFCESDKHHVIYNTKNGRFSRYCSLTAAEKELPAADFARCNNCYLVNLAYAESVSGYSLKIDGKELQISQPRKKKFLQKLQEYAEKHK